MLLGTGLAVPETLLLGDVAPDSVPLGLSKIPRVVATQADSAQARATFHTERLD